VQKESTMKKYTHVILDYRVAKLALQFCQVFGAESMELTFSGAHNDFLLSYKAPVDLNTAVHQFIERTNVVINLI